MTDSAPAPLLTRARLLWITGLFLITRLVTAIAGYYSNIRVEKFKYFQKQGHFTDPFFQWDSYWYMSIVRDGYHYVEGASSNVHFFPLFSLLVKLASLITGEMIVTGFVISNLAFLGAALYLDLLIRRDGHGDAVADKAVFYLLIFPTGFWLSLYYPESLYLMLSLGALYHARCGQWFRACALGGLLALTKTPGVFIAVPLAMEYFGVDLKRLWPTRWNRIDARVLWLALVPLGLGLYMMYLAVAFGEPMAFSKATATWSRKIVPFYVTFQNMDMYPLFEQILYYGTVLIGAASLIVGFAARLRLSYLVYTGMLFLLFISSNIFESIQRHVLMLFPVYWMLGLAGARSALADRAITVASVMLLTLFTVLFVAGYRMY
jgi:hypothetical protein